MTLYLASYFGSAHHFERELNIPMILAPLIPGGNAGQSAPLVNSGDVANLIRVYRSLDIPMFFMVLAFLPWLTVWQ